MMSLGLKKKLTLDLFDILSEYCSGRPDMPMEMGGFP